MRRFFINTIWWSKKLDTTIVIAFVPANDEPPATVDVSGYFTPKHKQIQPLSDTSFLSTDNPEYNPNFNYVREDRIVQLQLL